MQKMNTGWGVMALPWMIVALCLGIGACSRSTSTEQSSVASAPLAEPAPASVASQPTEVLTAPATEALAVEALEQDQDEDVAGKTLPDASYIHAPLRASYTACVEKSNGVTPDLKACADEEYAYHNERFRAAVATIMDSPDGVEKDRVLDELATWWEHTNTYCVWDPENDGQGQMLDAQSCLLNRVANHAPELEKIARQF